jgi:hypothetical protein
MRWCSNIRKCYHLGKIKISIFFNFLAQNFGATTNYTNLERTQLPCSDWVFGPLLAGFISLLPFFAPLTRGQGPLNAA